MPWGVLIFLAVVNTLNFFDRYIVQSVEPLLKQEFALTNKESGMLGAAFVLGYFIFSPIFGYLGASRDRRWLMGIGLLVWSACTALTGLAPTFLVFVLARIMVGVGEASFGSIVPGYLKGRISNPIQLNNALSIFFVAIPVGSALGYVVGGNMAEVWGWRSVFFAAAVPGILLSLCFVKIAPEAAANKRRSDTSHIGSGAQLASGLSGFYQGVKQIFSRSDLSFTIAGYVFNTFALNGIAMFVVRHGEGLGMEADDVAATFGGILVVTGFLGTLGGGFLASKLSAARPNRIKAMLAFISITTLLGAPCLAVAFLAKSPEWFFGACSVAEIALFAGVAPLNSVLVQRSPRGLETLTQGVSIFLINLFGAAAGMYAVGWATDLLLALPSVASEAAALALALQVTTIAMILSGLLWWIATCKTPPEGEND
jgi:predicted MFS family arabinose efflux permease